MLSSKVICALDVLRILDNARLAGRAGMKKSEVISAGCVDVLLYNSVLSVLARSRYVVRRSATVYYLNIDLSAVNLYDLIKIFHDDIVIGETVSISSLRGAFEFKDEYQRIVLAERAIGNELSKMLSNIRLSDALSQDSTTLSRPSATQTIRVV